MLKGASLERKNSVNGVWTKNVQHESFTLFSRGLGEMLPFHIIFRKMRLTSKARPIPIKTAVATEKNHFSEKTA